MARMRRRLNVVDKLGAAWNFTASARTALELAVWSSGASERMRTTMKERPPAVYGGCVTHTERAVGPGPLVSTSEGPSRASMVCVSQEAGGQKRSRVGSPELSF